MSWGFTHSDQPFILIPVSEVAYGIEPGSGIVGTYMPGGEVTVDYEGNIYNASNIKTWADRVYHAGDRHRTRYPTIARGVFDAAAFVAVGRIEDGVPQFRIELLAQNREAVVRWLGRESAQDLILSN